MSHKLEVNFEVFDHTNTDHIGAAAQIAEWSAQSASMIPLKDEAMSLHPLGILAFCAESGQLAGYAGITVQYNDALLEFGGLVTSPDLRRQGIGQSLTEYVLSMASEASSSYKQVIAFGNEKSGQLFKKLGGSTLSVLGRCALTKDVWKLCKTCPSKPSSFSVEDPGCCDRVYDLTKLTEVQVHA